MTTEIVRVGAGWLRLREGADARARAAELVGPLRARLPPARPATVHDLACGTGSMGRWLAPLLPGPARWVLHDRDPDLLEAARHSSPAPVETREGDITRLEPDDLAGADLITASALVDLLDAAELEAVVGVCASAACPVLVTLSVDGDVRLDPPDELDGPIAGAFNAHQRRARLLGPDAPALAATAFRHLGWEVAIRPSPWRLGNGDEALIGEWLEGWVSAACEQEPALARDADAYLRRRRAGLASGMLAATIGHLDILALP